MSTTGGSSTAGRPGPAEEGHAEQASTGTLDGGTRAEAERESGKGLPQSRKARTGTGQSPTARAAILSAPVIIFPAGVISFSKIGPTTDSAQAPGARRSPAGPDT